MNIRILVASIGLSFLIGQVKAQDSSYYRLGVQCRYQPVDFFAGIGGLYGKNQLQHEIQLNTGVNSTFFQRRMYPQISYRFTWLPLEKRWVQIGPVAMVNLSARRFNKASAHGFSWEEQFLGGFSIGCGGRSRVRLTVAGGRALEQNWSALEEKHINYTSWIFLGEFAYSYAF